MIEFPPTAAVDSVDEEKARKSRSKPRNPRVIDMITNAIKSLDEKKGSSVQAIKKFIQKTYQVDMLKLNVYIKKALRKAVEEGALIQTKGKGAVGSFKLPKKAAAATGSVEKKKMKPKKSEEMKARAAPAKEAKKSKNPKVK